MGCLRTRVCIPLLFILLTAAALVIVLFSSTTVINSINIGSRNVTVGGNATVGNVTVGDPTAGNVNGSLTLGPLGYCLTVSTGNQTCTKPKFLYTIDDTQILGQVKLGTIITKALSATNAVAVAGAIITLLTACGASASPCFRKTSRIIAGISAIVAIVEAALGGIFIMGSPGSPGKIGVGLIFIVIAALLFLVSIFTIGCMAGGESENPKQNQQSEEEIAAQREAQLQQEFLQQKQDEKDRRDEVREYRTFLARKGA